MELKHILAGITVVLLLVCMLMTSNPGRSYLQFTWIFFPLIDLNITPDHLGSVSIFDFAALLLLLLGGRRLYSFKTAGNIYVPVLALFFVSLLAGSLLSEFIQHSLIALVKTCSVFIYAHALLQEINEDAGFADQVIVYIKWGAVFSLLFLAGQLYWGAANFTFYPEVNENVVDSNLPRFTSFFQDPQKYAQYLGMVSFLVLTGVVGKTKQKGMNGVLFILLVLALLLTGGRAAALGFAISLALVALSMGWWFRIASAAAMLAFYFLADRLSAYFSLFARTDDYSDSYQVRHQIWQEALDIFFRHPLFGVGIGNHHDYVLKHSVDGYYVIDDKIVYYGTENGYLQLLVELGCIGFGLLVILLMVPFFKGVAQYFSAHNNRLLLLLAALLTWLIAYFTVDSLADKRMLALVTTVVVLLISETKTARAIHG